MTSLASIGVKKSQQQTTFHNDKVTIHWNDKNHNNKLPSIMTRLPSTGVTKMSRTNYLSIMSRLPSIGVRKISTTNYLP